MSTPFVHAKGFTLIELLIGLLLGLGTIAALTAALTVSLTARARAAAGAEMLAATASAIDQITRDVRLAGYDPRRSGIDGIVAADSASLVLEADLDGDGVIDPNSEEHVAYQRSMTGASLLRVVGAQSMPLLSDLAPGGPAFRYFDSSGSVIDPATAGAAAAIRTVSVELATLPSIGLPGVRMSGGARVLNR
jgi:Tfp pilus assembly protein PilW